MWRSKFAEDDAQVAQDVTQAYLTWVGSSASKYWSSYSGSWLGLQGDYYIWIEAFYVGSQDEADPEDYNSFENTMGTVHSDKIVSQTVEKFDTFFDKLVAQLPMPVLVKQNVEMMPSVLLNKSATINHSLTEDLINMWIPRCYRYFQIC